MRKCAKAPKDEENGGGGDAAGDACRPPAANLL